MFEFEGCRIRFEMFANPKARTRTFRTWPYPYISAFFGTFWLVSRQFFFSIFLPKIFVSAIGILQQKTHFYSKKWQILVDSKVNFCGFEAHFQRGSKQVRFGFDSGSKSQIRIRFGFDFFGFDTALISDARLSSRLNTKFWAKKYQIFYFI